MKNSVDFQYAADEIRDVSSIIHNFDVSVIMPFYKKLEEFTTVFPKNRPFLQRNGVEVIICMDEDSEVDGLLQFIKAYPFINWKVIVNPNEHEWRNPAKALNVGILHASKEYVLVCSPESEFASDIIYIMRRTLHYYPKHFVIGLVEFKSFDTNYNLMSPVPYGSIMVKRSYLMDIRGYDETLSKWGGDDDNLRARLEMIGVKKLLIPEANMVHWETEGELRKRAGKHSAKNRPILISKSILYPDSPVINGEDWGTDFDTVVYDWESKKNNEPNLISYLKRFARFELFLKRINKKYERILLAQSYNEMQRINRFLENSAVHFDALILLDDGSTDGTYENVKHEKLVLKVQKKRSKFNDLENRNLLLELVSFFNTEWIAFLDIDEIIEDRFHDFSFTQDSQIDVAAFHMIHLWNHQDCFNAEYPYSDNGIQARYKMFRNIGYSQIITHKEALHFPLTPYVKNVCSAKVLLIHYGHISEETRSNKFSFYLNEDKNNDQLSYSHFLNNNPKLRKTHDITLGELNVNLY